MTEPTPPLEPLLNEPEARGLTRDEIAARIAVATRIDWPWCIACADKLIASGRLKPGQTKLRRKDWRWIRRNL